MPRNEEGEYELVLGTPQLLSVIFILIVLLGVVFSAGYFLGRTAGGEIVAGPEEGTRRAASPGPGGSSQPAKAPDPAVPAELPPEAAAPLAPGEVKVASAGGAAADFAAPAPAAPQTQTPTDAQPQAPGAQPPPASARPATAEPAVGPSAIAEPERGQVFVQVAAVRRNEAEFLADVLRRKGFPARVAPGPNETLFRVLVGPVRDEDEIARTTKRLEAAGFRSTYVRKY